MDKKVSQHGHLIKNASILGLLATNTLSSLSLTEQKRFSTRTTIKKGLTFMLESGKRSSLFVFFASGGQKKFHNIRI
jgi:hypothetical protein